MNELQHVNKSPFDIPNVKRFVEFRIFFNSRFYYPVFTILFLDFGLTVSQFAILNAVWAASIVLLEVPSGALADTIGRRNLLVFAGAIMIVEIAILCFLPLHVPGILFPAFIVNRILSGAAEAAASGADEAIAYDSLKNDGYENDWGLVLETQMRMKAVFYILAMSIGAAVYDPDLMNNVSIFFGFSLRFTQEMTLRFPLYLTLVMAVLTFITTIRMKEVTDFDDAGYKPIGTSFSSIRESLVITLKAGKWILNTPFAFSVILAAMLFDHVLRMFITLNSQYLRAIHLPEASFGLIGSALAVLGLFIPRVARHLAEKSRPGKNLFILAGATFIGLTGLTFFIPYYGVIPVALLSSLMYFVGFLTSHYINKIADSKTRATVLSFKGLSFNIAYGAVGIFYSILYARLKSGYSDVSTEVAENKAFMDSITWFPGYFVLLFALYLIYILFIKEKIKI